MKLMKIKSRVKLFTVIFTVLAISGCTTKPQDRIIKHRQVSEEVATQYMNQFVFNGEWIICITDSLQKDNPNACSHFGMVGFGTSLGEFTELFGESAKTIENADGSITNIFLLAADSTSEYSPYLVVNKLNGNIESLQMTGESTLSQLSFSGLSLGSSSEDVISTLGPPSERTLVDEIGGEMFDYDPFHFTFEIVNGLIYSIRLTTY